MKAQLLRRVCCGCIEAVAEASSSPPQQQPVFIEMSPRPPPRSLPPPASSLTATVKKTSLAISSASSSSNNLSISSSRGKALYTKVEEVPEEKRNENDEDGCFLGKRHALPPQDVDKPSAAPVPSTNFSSSTSATTFASFPHANPRPEPTNEPSLLHEESEEEHTTDTSTSASTSQIPTQSPLVPTSKNWAAAYVLASPTPPPADPVRESFIARLVEGVPVTKHNRKGQSRVRELCTLDNGETFTWREGGGGGDKAGHRRHRSSAGSSLFGGARESYAFGDIIEVRRGTVPDPSSPGETGTALLRSSCEKRDLYRSFSLITADRTVDFSCDQVEDMSFLVKGFMALSHEQRRRRVRRAGSSGVGVGGA